MYISIKRQILIGAPYYLDPYVISEIEPWVAGAEAPKPTHLDLGRNIFLIGHNSKMHAKRLSKTRTVVA